MEDMLKKHQKIRFSGSDASHQNDAADRSIKTVVTMSKNMLTHNALIFPDDIFPPYPWTMAMEYSVWIYTRIPDINSCLYANNIWKRSKFEPVS